MNGRIGELQLEMQTGRCAGIGTIEQRLIALDQASEPQLDTSSGRIGPDALIIVLIDSYRFIGTDTTSQPLQSVTLSTRSWRTREPRLLLHKEMEGIRSGWAEWSE